jgi:hypothetical protein
LNPTGIKISLYHTIINLLQKIIQNGVDSGSGRLRCCGGSGAGGSRA